MRKNGRPWDKGRRLVISRGLPGEADAAGGPPTEGPCCRRAREAGARSEVGGMTKLSEPPAKEPPPKSPATSLLTRSRSHRRAGEGLGAFGA
jgi:hypothetical protein